MKSRALTFIVYGVFIIFSGIIHSQVLSSDSLALVALYDSTDGSNWSHPWDLNSPVSTWGGVTTSNGRVIKLRQVDNTLDGTIPPAIGNLSELIELELRSTNPYLSYANKLTGSIPPELGNLSKLSILKLEKNQLSGSIPPELGNLTGLVILELQFNKLNDTLPPELGNLHNLWKLNIWGNQLTGDIPEEFSNLTALTFFHAIDNQLTGNLDPFMGMIQLKELLLNKNSFNGPIPSVIRNLYRLETLWLSENNLTGQLPGTLGSIATLKRMDLSINNFSDTLHSEIGNLTNITEFDVSSNQIVGTVPESFLNMTRLEILDLSNNKFDQLPEFNSITTLATLLIDNNYFSFDDILPNLGAASSVFQFSPQKDVTADTSFVWGKGGNIILKAPEFDGLATSYQWYKNDVSLLEVYLEDGIWKSRGGSDTLNIRNMQISDYARYRVVANNSTIGPLHLSSGDIQLYLTSNVAPAWGDNPDFTALENDTTKITLQAYDIYGDLLTYSVMSDTSVIDAFISDSVLHVSPYSSYRGTATIFTSVTDGEFTLLDTIIATFNSPPVLTEIPDIEVDEDTEYELIVNVTDSDQLTTQISSAGFGVNIVASDSGWILRPEPDWNGNKNIAISVSDSLTTVRDTFLLTVIPVADMPGPFTLYQPAADSILTLKTDHIVDTIKFTWSPSQNVDATPLIYNVWWQSTVDNSYLWVGSFTDTVGHLILDSSWVNDMIDAGITEITGVWNVRAIVSPYYIDAKDNGRIFTLRIPETLFADNTHDQLPKSFILNQNYPNPFNPITMISYQLPDDSDVKITIYNIMGREVATLINERQKAGYRSIRWNGTDHSGRKVSGGIYIYHIHAGNFNKAMKMVLLK